MSKSVTKVFYIKELVKLECKDNGLGSSFYDYVVILQRVRYEIWGIRYENGNFVAPYSLIPNP